MNEVVTRRGKSTENVEIEEIPDEGLIEVDLEIWDDLKQAEEAVIQPKIEKEKQKDPKPKIILSYPSRTRKKDLNEKFFEKFLEYFKKLKINIPFAEALEQMHIYAKFMKDIISKKRSLDTIPVMLTETCSAIF